jgi:hypothetical protein
MDWRIRTIGAAYEGTAQDLVTAIAVMLHTAQVWQLPVEVVHDGSGILVGSLDPKDITDTSFVMNATDDASLFALLSGLAPAVAGANRPDGGASSLPRTSYILPDAKPEMLRSEGLSRAQAQPGSTAGLPPSPPQKPARSNVKTP